jgi:hypothetical protein
MRTDRRETIWVAEIDQEIGKTIVIPCTTRGVARTESERVASELNDPIESWIEDWGGGTSECGVMESGRHAVISQSYLVGAKDTDTQAQETS